MIIQNLRLIGYRNFDDYTFSPKEGLNYFSGENGVGKTNIIEAMFFASMGKSFRTSYDQELIKLGVEDGTILLTYLIRNVSHEIKVKLSRTQGKKISLNENSLKRKELMGLFRTVLFTPDELMLIKGPPQGRRRFLDMEISQVSPRYYEEFLRYSRAVQQRNAAFRVAQMRGKPADVDIWDMQIATSACYMVKKRMESIQKMNAMASEMEQLLTGNKENLEIRYVQQGAEEIHTDMEWYLEKLSKSREEDAKLCHTSVGPHRDDLKFMMNGLDISAYGSQGQQRTAILAMKLAETEFIKEETGEYPVLLLDDIGSELDGKRKKALFNFLKENHIQGFMTGTDLPHDFEDINIIQM